MSVAKDRDTATDLFTPYPHPSFPSHPSLRLPQARVLAGQLRDAQNLIMAKDREVAAAERKAAAPGAQEAGVVLLREQRKVAELQQEMNRWGVGFRRVGGGGTGLGGS